MVGRIRNFISLIQKLMVVLFFISIFIYLIISAFLEKDFSIQNYDITVYINKDGSVKVEETITFKFKGEFSAIYYDLDFSKTSGIFNETLYVKDNENTKKIIHDNTKESKGYYSKIKQDKEIIRYTVYEPSKDETKSFVFSYDLHKALTSYNDISEFNRKLIGKNWARDVKNLNITIYLPDKSPSKKLFIFSHGPLNGMGKIIDNKTLKFTSPLIPKGQFFEVRVLFPNELVYLNENIVNKDALNEILKQENIWVEEANEIRKKENLKLIKHNIGKVIIFLFLGATLFILRNNKKNYGTDPKVSFNQKYFREPPTNYSPAEIKILFHSLVTVSELFATLLNLVRLGVLSINISKNIKKKIFNSEIEKDYIFKIEKSYDNLLEHEKFLIKWLFNDIGNGNTFSISNLKNYLKVKKNKEKNNESNSIIFQRKFKVWENTVHNDAKRLKFFPIKKEKNKNLKFGFYFLILGLLLGAILQFGPLASISIFGIIIMIHSSVQWKRTEFGSEEYQKCLAFKKYIEDFSKLNESEISSIIIWEKYLVYAIPLGVSTKLIKQFQHFAENNNDFLRDATFTSAIIYDKTNRHHDINKEFDSFSRAVNDTFSSALSSNSSFSSASGSGGGSSSGDSGGGGGSSGGGAF